MVALDDTRTAAACTGVPPFLVYVCALPCLCVCKSELLALIPEMHADHLIFASGAHLRQLRTHLADKSKPQKAVSPGPTMTRCRTVEPRVLTELRL
jgi:hypothetical protein